jgi:hypothetical protein
MHYRFAISTGCLKCDRVWPTILMNFPENSEIEQRDRNKGTQEYGSVCAAQNAVHILSLNQFD